MPQDPNQTLLAIINHAIAQHPELAPTVERLASVSQGKGHGTSVQQEVDFVETLLTQPPRIALDVGANIGSYTEALLDKFKSLEQVILFEPDQENVDLLRTKFSENPVVRVESVALAENSGNSILYADKPGSPLGSLTRRRLDHFGISFNQEQSIQTIRFEDYWRINMSEAIIDIAKVDVEGHELAVLNGFGPALKRTKVVQFEFGGTCIDTRVFFQDFWYLLTELQFIIFRMTPSGLRRVERYFESDEYFSLTNYVALNNLIDK